MSLSTRAVGTVIAAVLPLSAATLPTAEATPWCGADSLSLSTSPPISPGEQQYIHFNILLTNISQQTCTLQGYPGVDLVGTTDRHLGIAPDPRDPPFSGIVSAARTGGDVQPVVLAPGATAASLLGFLPKTTSTGIAPAWPPTTVVVTPPDSTTQLQTPWIPGDFTVLLIGNGTQPSVTIQPLQPYS